MDQQDPNLTGENVETPADSPSETITPGEGSQVNQQGAATQSLEEVSWNNLTGSSQERFRDLSRSLNQERLEKERLEAEIRRLQFGGSIPTPQALSQSTVTPEIKSAVNQLSDYGVATKDFVAQTAEQMINNRLSGIVYNMEMDRLAGKHNGSDGLPSFSRDEYEAYIGTHPQYRNYSPEDVYTKMYEDDIFDARVKTLGKSPQSKGTPSLRPTRTRVQEEPLSPEYIEQRLKEPDGREWYERHQQEINSVVSKIPAPVE